MKISYAIPVCNEYKEIEYLLEYLAKHKREQDEIVVQCDQGNTTPDVYRVLQELTENGSVSYELIEFPLNNNFAAFKNNLKNNCSGDYIFQIDADEMVSKYMVENIGMVLQYNSVDVLKVPRINTVKGLTQEHINKWRWGVNEQGWVNFPDAQKRIYKNDPSIKWSGHQVHGMVEGFKTYVALPFEERFSIYHNKQINRQEQQNARYAQIENERQNG